MIDLYYWTTANGHKTTLFLEEANVPYTIIPINISKGEQFERSFLQIAPNTAYLHLKRWYDAIALRPATQRAYALVEKINTVPTIHDEQARKILFGQTAASLTKGQ